MRPPFPFSILIAAAVGVMPLSVMAQDMPNIAIVLDGSGSMWGQIDGRPKLEIARDVLAEVLADTPADTSLGLIAYGHNRKGDCKDIEVLVPAAPGTANAIRDAAAGMRFLGKTPLVQATRQAAENLRYTEEKATVIVITDGLETCGGDVCALAQELEQQGLDMTAHVVGFGLSREEGDEIACLARDTGGSYFDATDASSLTQALTETIVQAAPLPFARLIADQTAQRGATVSITWEGPGREGDFIDVVDFDGPGAKAYDSIALNGTSPVSLQMSADLGQVFLRYMQPMTATEAAAAGDGTTARSLAVRPIEVIEVDFDIIAPDVVQQAQRFQFNLSQGAAQGSSVGLFPADQPGVDGWAVSVDATLSAPLIAQAPIETGPYELRYIVPGSGESYDIVSARPITVIPAEVSIAVAPRLAAGRAFDVSWTGPVGGDNWIDLTDLNEPGLFGYDGYTTYDYEYLTADTASTLTLNAPDIPGNYELRFVASVSVGQFPGAERAVLLRRPITVVNADDVDADLTAPQPQQRIVIPTDGKDVDALVNDLFEN